MAPLVAGTSWWHCLCEIVDPMCPIRKCVSQLRPEPSAGLQGVLPSSPPQDSHAAFMNTLRRLLSSAELCLLQDS